jgi:hypothetical protein
VRLTSGRSWIAVLCALLGGIVALNVISLSLNAGSGRISQQVAELERSNSSLRAELAETLSSSRIEQLAAGAGLGVPHPSEVAYLSAKDANVASFLAMLDDGTLLTRGEPPTAPTETDYYAVPASEVAAQTAAEIAEAAPVPSSSTPAPSSSTPAPSGSTSGGVGL